MMSFLTQEGRGHRTVLQQRDSPVIVKYFKAVDIQDANDCVFPMYCSVIVLHFNHIIDVCHNPTKEALVYSLPGNKY